MNEGVSAGTTIHGYTKKVDFTGPPVNNVYPPLIPKPSPGSVRTTYTVPASVNTNQ